MPQRRVKGNPDCTDCDLYRTCQIVNIMGKGPENAKIMVVLDSPGLMEDNTGRPIDGKNRDFLKQLFEEAGINWKDCYITNAVKCRPPAKYSIKVKEINACRQYLDKEIKVIKPKFVLLMGATALKWFKGKEKAKITEEHGMIFERDGAYYMPVFSPGVAYQDPKKLTPLKTDLKKFANLIKGKKVGKPKLNVHVVEGFSDFNEMIMDLKENKVTSFDIETTGLNRFEGEITMIGFGLKNKQWILPLQFPFGRFNNQPDIQNQMLAIVSEVLNTKKTEDDKKRVNVTHNGKFDNLWIRKHYGARIHNHFDTQIAHYCLDENDGHGLKYIARILLGAEDWDIGKELKTSSGELTKRKAKKLYEYLAYDVYYTRKLYFYLNEKLKEDEAVYKLFKKLMMPIFHVYEDVQMEGVWIRKEKFDEVEKLLNNKVQEIDEKLEEIKQKEGLKIDNWNSAVQIKDVLYNQLGLPVVETTAKGAPSTSESALKQLRDKHSIIPLLMERRGVKQQLSFFIKGWKKWMVNSRLYPNFNIHVTVTGRTSSNDPNLQQVPRDKKIRSLIGAPPGWTFVEADYSQVELRIAAMLSGDTTMINTFINNLDIHSKTASSLNGKPIDQQTKEDRKSAKAVNFGFVYGMGWRKFKDYARDNYGVTLTDEEAQLYRKRFFETYSDLPAWHEKQRRIARMYKQVRNLIGRVRRLPEIDSPDSSKVAEAERQAINSPVQSFGSDLMLMSLIELHKKLPKDKFRIVGSVHDAGLFIVRDDALNEIVPQIKEIMENPRLMKIFGVSPTVPIVAEVEIGDWGAGKSWEPGQKIIPNGDGTVEIVDKV